MCTYVCTPGDALLPALQAQLRLGDLQTQPQRSHAFQHQEQRCRGCTYHNISPGQIIGCTGRFESKRAYGAQAPPAQSFALTGSVARQYQYRADNQIYQAGPQTHAIPNRSGHMAHMYPTAVIRSHGLCGANSNKCMDNQNYNMPTQRLNNLPCSTRRVSSCFVSAGPTGGPRRGGVRKVSAPMSCSVAMMLVQFP